MSENEMTFEQAMTRLEEIVRAMERGDAPLAETLSLFEEGTKLCKLCSDALERAAQRVTILTKQDDGHVVEQKFGDTDGTT